METKNFLETKLNQKEQERENLAKNLQQLQIQLQQEMNRLNDEKQQVCDQLTEVHFMFEEKKAEFTELSSKYSNGTIFFLRIEIDWIIAQASISQLQDENKNLTEEATTLGMNLAEMKELFAHTDKLLQDSKQKIVLILTFFLLIFFQVSMENYHVEKTNEYEVHIEDLLHKVKKSF